MDELERGCLFCRNTLVGVTTIGDRGSWSYPINLGPLKCTRPPSSREGVQLSILVPLFYGCQYLVQLSIIVSIGLVSIVIVWYKRVSVNNLYINHLVHLSIDIDSHEEIYLFSPNVSSSSCANAISIGGSCGWIKLVRLCLSGSAFVPSSLIPIWRASWACVNAARSSFIMPRWGSLPSTHCWFSGTLYKNVVPSDCDMRILCCSSVNSMLLSPAAIRLAFEGKVGWSLHMSSSSICSSGVVGHSGVLGTVSLRGMFSISWSSVFELPEETITISGSGCRVKGLGHGLTCNGLVTDGPEGGCHRVCISGCCQK